MQGGAGLGGAASGLGGVGLGAGGLGGQGLQGLVSRAEYEESVASSLVNRTLLAV